MTDAVESTFDAGEQPAEYRAEPNYAEHYRDEVILPRGGCGFMWAHPYAPKHGNYACERARNHGGAHQSGSATWPWSTPNEFAR